MPVIANTNCCSNITKIINPQERGKLLKEKVYSSNITKIINPQEHSQISTH